MQDLTISLFPGVKSNRPTPKAVSWPTLAKMLTDFEVRETKDGPLWSPARYPKGKTRALPNVIDVSCFVIEYDSGIQPEEVRPLWEAFTYALHSTFSSTRARPKFRVVFPLAEPVSAADFPGVHRKLRVNLGGPSLDDTVHDATRIWYLPSHPPGEPSFSAVHAGIRIEPDYFDDVPEEPPVRAHRLEPARSDPTRVPDELLMRRALDRAAMVGRNNAGFFLACQLRDNGYSTSETERVLLAYQGSVSPYNLRGEPDPYTEKEALHAVRSANTRPAREPWSDVGRKGGSARAAAKTATRKGRKAAQEPQEATPNGSGVLTAEAAANASDLAPDAPTEDNGQRAPTPTTEKELGHLFARERRSDLMVSDGGAWWRYERGVWRPTDRHGVLMRVEAFLESRSAASGYARLIENVAKVAGYRLHVPLAEMNAKPGWIPLRNGILDTGTGKFLEHAPVYRLTTQLPYDYDPQAECPRWEQFLAEMVLDLHGRPSDELAGLIQEWFGYCLIPHAGAQTSMWWTGGGANGKGVATKVLEALVGSHQRTVIDIEQLHEPYFRAELFGKLLGIVNEMKPRDMVKNGGVFKALVSADSINARRPGQQPFDFEPYCRVLCVTNELPRAADQTFGYFRRLLILPWRRNLAEAQQDRGLLDVLLDEMPGIFNWSMIGLGRMQRQNYHFSHSEEADRELKEYRREEDLPQRFIEECCVKEEDAQETSSVLWKAYMGWCKANGETYGTSTSFGRALTRLGFPRALLWDKDGQKPNRVRPGIRLLVPYEDTLPYEQ